MRLLRLLIRLFRCGRSLDDHVAARLKRSAVSNRRRDIGISNDHSDASADACRTGHAHCAGNHIRCEQLVGRDADVAAGNHHAARADYRARAAHGRIVARDFSKLRRGVQVAVCVAFDDEILAFTRLLIAGGIVEFVGEIAIGHIHAAFVAHLHTGGALAVAREVFGKRHALQRAVRGGVAGFEGLHEPINVKAAGGTVALCVVLHQQRVMGILLQFVANDGDHDRRAHRRHTGAGNAAGVAAYVALGPGRQVYIATEGIDGIIRAQAGFNAVFQHIDHGRDAHRRRT